MRSPSPVADMTIAAAPTLQDVARFTMEFHNRALPDLDRPEMLEGIVGRIDLYTRDGDHHANLILRTFPATVPVGEKITLDFELYVGAHDGEFEVRPSLFRRATDTADLDPLIINAGSAEVAIRRSDHAAAMMLVGCPDKIWGLERTPIVVELHNNAIAELAAGGCGEGYVAEIDLLRTDGSVVGKILSRPVERDVEIGGSVTLELECPFRVFEGEYALRPALRRVSGSEHGQGATDLSVYAKSTPVSITGDIKEAFIELTNVCNFRCTFCPQGDLERESAMMDLDLAKKILGDLADMGHHRPIRLHLLGEPLLYPRMAEFVEAAHAVGQRICIATNGSRFQEERIDMLFETGADELLISLNTPEEEGYLAQRGTNVSFERYMDGIRRFVAELIRRGPPPKTTINFLYDRDRADHPDEQARVQGIANEWIGFVSEISGQSLPRAEDVVELQVGGSAVMQLHDGLSLMWTCYHNWGEGAFGGSHFCSYPWRQLAIMVDGKATACCVDAQGENVIGDATEQTVREIWTGEPIERMRRGFLEGRAVTDRCTRCDIGHCKEDYFQTETSS